MNKLQLATTAPLLALILTGCNSESKLTIADIWTVQCPSSAFTADQFYRLANDGRTLDAGTAVAVADIATIATEDRPDYYYVATSDSSATDKIITALVDHGTHACTSQVTDLSDFASALVSKDTQYKFVNSAREPLALRLEWANWHLPNLTIADGLLGTSSQATKAGFATATALASLKLPYENITSANSMFKNVTFNSIKLDLSLFTNLTFANNMFEHATLGPNVALDFTASASLTAKAMLEDAILNRTGNKIGQLDLSKIQITDAGNFTNDNFTKFLHGVNISRIGVKSIEIGAWKINIAGTETTLSALNNAAAATFLAKLEDTVSGRFTITSAP